MRLTALPPPGPSVLDSRDAYQKSPEPVSTVQETISPAPIGDVIQSVRILATKDKNPDDDTHAQKEGERDCTDHQHSEFGVFFEESWFRRCGIVWWKLVAHPVRSSVAA
jgi:hypothetical protein